MRTWVEMVRDAKELAKEHQHLAENPDMFLKLCTTGFENWIFDKDQLARIGWEHNRAKEEYEHHTKTAGELNNLYIEAHKSTIV